MLLLQKNNSKNSSRKSFLTRPLDKSRAFTHYDRQGHYYNQKVEKGIFSELRKRERASVEKLANFASPSHITMIDVGCGGGYYALQAKARGLTVSAVDFSPKMIAHIARHVDYAWVSDVEQPISSSTYDLIICSGVLDFVISPEAAFSHLVQLMHETSRLVIQVPRDGIFGWVYRLEKRFLGMKVNLFSKNWFLHQALRHDLECTGYEIPLPHNMVIAFTKKQRPFPIG